MLKFRKGASTQRQRIGRSISDATIVDFFNAAWNAHSPFQAINGNLMSQSELTIDLSAVSRNWSDLDRLTGSEVETAAVVKADAYGLGTSEIAACLAASGARSFFVALAHEGAEVRQAAGADAEIFVLSGHMEGDASAFRRHSLTPLLNSASQFARHERSLRGHPYGIQLDTGMNRLGMEGDEFRGVAERLSENAPCLVMSHLACADEPNNPINQMQLREFRRLTDGMAVRRSLSATAGMLLGPEYHFDLCRPGIGLYGGFPFNDGHPVVSAKLKTVQHRDLAAGEFVGYAASWRADRPMRVATLAAGYADGILRISGGTAKVYADGIPCPIVGRISMDLLGVDVSHLDKIPSEFELLGPNQTIDDLAADSKTIGHEVLTCLGSRYARTYVGSTASGRA